MSNRTGKSGVRVSNITSWHQTAPERARFPHQSTPSSSLFPFPFPPPFTPIHYSTTHHHTRKSASAASLSMQASNQASKASAHVVSERSRNFLIGATQLTSYLFTDIPTYKRWEIKYFGVILPMRIGKNDHSYALLAARHARGGLFFGHYACEIRRTVKVLNRRKKVL